MSTRMPPRGRTPQRAPYKPPAAKEEYQAPSATPAKGRHKAFDIVIILVVVALVAIFAKALAGPVSVAGAGPTLNLGGKTAKPGKASPGATAAVQGAPVSDRPVITEIMTSNTGSITTENGQYTDWIELYNPTGKTINLMGFALSDNLKKPTKFVLPSYSLEAGKYAIIYADGGKSTDTELHASFKLKASGTQLTFVDPNGYEVQAPISVPALETDRSYALGADNKWTITDKYTPGFPNTNEGYGAYEQTRHSTADIAINEVMAGNTLTIKDEDGEYSDWIELYNPTDKAVDITGWGLSNKESEPKRWVFPKTSIEPKKYLVIYASGKNRAEEGKELHTDFRLNAFKDTVLLSNLRGQIVSEVQLNSLKPDESYALVPGTDKWQTFAHPTPGYPNNEEGWNALQPKLYNSESNEPVVINEVMSGNTDTVKDQFNEYPDWIELYNRSNKAVDLKDYGLTNKSDELGRWKFPDITIAAGQYMTVFASGRNLTDGDALSKNELHTDFAISGGGGMVALTAPDGHVADRCFVPALRVGDSYGRVQSSMLFNYITSPTPDAANQNGFPGQVPDPLYSIKAGMYDGAQKVSLSTDDPEAKIYYTLNGTAPTQNSTQYTGPIDLTKTASVRAVAYRDGYLPSNAVCSTYLINEGISLPVVSLVTDPKNLFDENTGIYAKGPGASSKFPYTGANFWKDWEKPAHMELLEPDGTVGISQDIGIKIFGAYSRGNDQKSFALMARSKYGKSGFDYPVFPDLPYTSYKDLVIRNSAQDANMSRIRDILQVGLAQETADVDSQDHRQSILFINGEFWGVYDIMEKVNTHFLAQHHNLDPNKIDLLVGNAKVVNGSNQDYKDLLEYVKTHDLSNQDNYNYVASKIDIDNYIDWVSMEIYTVNSDLGNVKFWKPQTPDGKWRWILYDLDWGFFFANQDKYQSYQDSFSKFLDPQGNGVGHMFDNSLIRALLQNEGFRDKFIKRFTYHCTVTFETDRVLQRIDQLVANIEPYMQRDKDKWNNGTVARWKSVQVELLKTFAKIRPAMNLKYMQKYFNLSDADMRKYLTDDQMKQYLGK